MLDLAYTEHHLAGLCGVVVHERDGVILTRWPELPEYFTGNALWLRRAPKERELRGLLARFDVSFPDERIRHASLRWCGDDLDDDAAADVFAMGMRQETALAMRLARVPEAREPAVPVVLRPLEGPAEWAALVELNRRNDATECNPERAAYRAFKEGLRDHWRQWVDKGAATWWGAFHEGELMAACGLVDTPWGGRFQSVETDAAWRRRGVCSALVTEVARQALTEGGHEAVHLSAEPEGPALGLYEGLGFECVGFERSVTWMPTDPH